MITSWPLNDLANLPLYPSEGEILEKIYAILQERGGYILGGFVRDYVVPKLNGKKGEYRDIDCVLPSPEDVHYFISQFQEAIKREFSYHGSFFSGTTVTIPFAKGDYMKIDLMVLDTKTYQPDFSFNALRYNGKSLWVNYVGCHENHFTVFELVEQILNKKGHMSSEVSDVMDHLEYWRGSGVNRQSQRSKMFDERGWDVSEPCPANPFTFKHVVSVELLEKTVEFLSKEEFLKDLHSSLKKHDALIFGGYIRDYLVPETLGLYRAPSFNDIDIWFPSNEKRQEFIQSRKDFLLREPMLSGQRYKGTVIPCHFVYNGGLIKLDLVVAPEIVITDFSVNLLTFDGTNLGLSAPYYSLPDLILQIMKRETFKLSPDSSRLDMFKDRGWKVR